MQILNKIAVFDEIEKGLSLFKEKFSGIVYNLEDDDQMKQAMDNKHSISKWRGAIDAKHKIGKAKAKAECDLWDSEKNRIRGVADIEYQSIDLQIKAHKQKAIDHESELIAMVSAIEVIADFDLIREKISIEKIISLIDELESIKIDNSYEYLEANAHMAKSKAMDKLLGKQALLEKEKAEHDKQEQDRIELQKKREQEIAKEAAFEAEKKAEIAEKARKDAEKQAKINAEIAEKNRLADINKAKLKAENDKRAAVEEELQQERARVAEVQRIADIEEAKLQKAKQNQNNRKIVHSMIKKSYFENGFSENESVFLTKLLINNSIKKVSIEY